MSCVMTVYLLNYVISLNERALARAEEVRTQLCQAAKIGYPQKAIFAHSPTPAQPTIWPAPRLESASYGGRFLPKNHLSRILRARVFLWKSRSRFPTKSLRRRKRGVSRSRLTSRKFLPAKQAARLPLRCAARSRFVPGSSRSRSSPTKFPRFPKKFSANGLTGPAIHSGSKRDLPPSPFFA